MVGSTFVMLTPLVTPEIVTLTIPEFVGSAIKGGGAYAGKGGLGIRTITNYQGMIALRSLVGLIVEDDPLNFLYGLPNGLQ